MIDFLKNCLFGKKLREPVVVDFNGCEYTFNYRDDISNLSQVVYQSQMDLKGDLVLKVSFSQSKKEVETLTRVAVFYKNIPIAGSDLYLMPSFFMFYSQPYKFFEDKKVKQTIAKVLEFYSLSGDIDLLESLVEANNHKNTFFCNTFKNITTEYHEGVYQSYSFEVLKSFRVADDMFFSCQFKAKISNTEGKESKKIIKFYSFKNIVYLEEVNRSYNDHYNFEDYMEIREQREREKDSFYGIDDSKKFKSLMKSLSKSYKVTPCFSSKSRNDMKVMHFKDSTILVNVDFRAKTVLVLCGDQFKVSNFSNMEDLADTFICSMLGFMASFDRDIFEFFGFSCDITPDHLSLVEMNLI